MKKKDSRLDTFLNEDMIFDSQITSSAMKSGKPIRKINPLGMRVVVRIEELDNVSDGGLYLPEGAKESMAQSLLARVIEVASAVDDDTDEETNVSGIPLHSFVLIPKSAGISVPWDSKLRIVATKDILATILNIEIT